MRTLAASVILSCVTAASASAQDWSERVWIAVNGGIQGTPSAFSDTIEIRQFVETGSIATEYPRKISGLADGSVGVRLWRGLGAGIAVSRSSNRGLASIDARIPHPFFDNQPRTVQGTTSVAHTELGVHVQVAYAIRFTDRVRAIASGGPSWLSVEQTFVTDVQYAQEYPYDTATFTGATTRRNSTTAAGYHVGADVTWMFADHVGAGGLVRFTRASANETVVTGHTASRNVGGLQTGVGVRLAF